MVKVRTARSTGTKVVVGSADELGLDLSDGETKWYTICETHHGQCVGHRTKALADSHSTNPEGWCEICMAYINRASDSARADHELIAVYEREALAQGETPHDSSKRGRRFGQ